MAKKYLNGCIVCGTTKVRHKKDGICINCWNKEFYEDSELQRKDKYEWSIEYPCCTLCGTTKHRNVSNGICSKCFQRKNNTNIELKTCSVCGEKYVQIFRHWRQEIKKKKNKEHTKYLKNILEECFNSNLNLTKIADKLETSRHNVTRWFNYFFGKEEIKKKKRKSKMLSHFF